MQANITDKTYCKYCETSIGRNQVMCDSTECRRLHNQANAVARWSRASDDDRTLQHNKMNAAKSPATREDIGRRGGLASGKARAKTANLKEQLMAELFDVIVNNCYDAPFELTK